LPLVLGIVLSGANAWAEPGQGRPGASTVQVAGFPVIRTSVMDISYEIEGAAWDDLAQVELWFALGIDGAWQLYNYDHDMHSPVRFIAQREGIYRFLVVAVDRWGRRSFYQQGQGQKRLDNSVPVDVPAQLTVFIDYTPPQLYLYNPRGAIKGFREDSLPICWAGFDANPTSQPVMLYYQQGEEGAWVPLSSPQPARGEYTWELTADLAGPIRVKVVMTDQAGHQDVQVSGFIEVVGKTTAFEESVAASAAAESGASASESATSEIVAEPVEDREAASPEMRAESDIETTVSENQQKWATLCFQRGMLHKQRMEWAAAVQAFQEALDNDPNLAEAQINLANALCRTGHFSEAQEHFKLSLQDNPHSQSAMFGLAQAQIASKEYDAAQASLRRLLEYNPKDWQGWLIYGDAADKLGNREAALYAWQQAAEGDLPSITQMALVRLNGHNP